jgi:hypothetical protein
MNQGAESVLAFQFACCAFRDLAVIAQPQQTRPSRPKAANNA